MNDLQFLESIKPMPFMNLPVQSTFVSLDKGGVLISPGSCLTPEQLKSLPPVTDIVGSSHLHVAGLKLAWQCWPQAQLWVPPGSEKRKFYSPEMRILSAEAWPYMNELPLIEIEGMSRVREFVFVHIKSKTLIVTDLFFHMTNVSGLGAWFITGLFGTYKRFAMSKFFAKYIENRSAFLQSMKNILSYDFDKIVVSHGVNIESQGRELFQKALRERGLSVKN